MEKRKGGRKKGRTLPEALEYREIWENGIFGAGQDGVSLLRPLSPAGHHSKVYTNYKKQPLEDPEKLTDQERSQNWKHKH